MGRAATAQGASGDTVVAAEQAITVEPFRESAYLAIMTAYARAGSRGEAANGVPCGRWAHATTPPWRMPPPADVGLAVAFT